MNDGLASQTRIDPERCQWVASRAERVQAEMRKVFIGDPGIVEALLVTLLARGHVLVEGVPGVAKTTLAKGFAGVLNCSFRRIQFTPDLLPSDITGTYVLDMRSNEFQLRPGPLFAQVVLGDEINRAPAKTQSALLEAMQESQVTIEGTTQPLPQPFLVLATQNPVEQEGVYLLPEAQLDRFLMKLALGYPGFEDEMEVLRTHDRQPEEVRPVLEPEEVLQMARLCDEVHLAEELKGYILRLVRYSRNHKQVLLGNSPRAAISLMRSAKARSLLHGRDYVLPDDIRQVAAPILAHRVILKPEAELHGLRGEDVVKAALREVPYDQS
ncbi:MAG: MoxR family ATPase [Bradymonadales bacterium]|nr:MoxR family ATPase [Bradymonadales bacterium]